MEKRRVNAYCLFSPKVSSEKRANLLQSLRTTASVNGIKLFTVTEDTDISEMEWSLQQAPDVLCKCDIVFLMDKGAETSDLYYKAVKAGVPVAIAYKGHTKDKFTYSEGIDYCVYLTK